MLMKWVVEKYPERPNLLKLNQNLRLMTSQMRRTLSCRIEFNGKAIIEGQVGVDWRWERLKGNCNGYLIKVTVTVFWWTFWTGFDKSDCRRTWSGRSEQIRRNCLAMTSVSMGLLSGISRNNVLKVRSREWASQVRLNKTTKPWVSRSVSVKGLQVRVAWYANVSTLWPCDVICRTGLKRHFVQTEWKTCLAQTTCNTSRTSDGQTSAVLNWRCSCVDPFAEGILCYGVRIKGNKSNN